VPGSTTITDDQVKYLIGIFDGTIYPKETAAFSTPPDHNGSATIPGTLTVDPSGTAAVTAYNLTGLYAEGFDGSGQTIAIIDWCGSLTITDDANAFSAQFGLPQLTSSNFNIIYTPTQSLCQATDQVEINIDVEWAHAIAPGANINLIVPPSASSNRPSLLCIAPVNAPFS